MSERIYRLTVTGREAWESQDAAAPADYRRLLWLMDFHGHSGLMSKLVRTYPGHILDEWLGELDRGESIAAAITELVNAANAHGRLKRAFGAKV